MKDVDLCERQLQATTLAAIPSAATTATTAEREQSRWLVALVASLIAACASLCAVFATAGGARWTNWLFLPVILLVPTWVVTLQYLALTSDTNTADERVDVLAGPSSTSTLDRRAA